MGSEMKAPYYSSFLPRVPPPPESNHHLSDYDPTAQHSPELTCQVSPSSKPRAKRMHWHFGTLRFLCRPQGRGVGVWMQRGELRLGAVEFSNSLVSPSINLCHSIFITTLLGILRLLFEMRKPELREIKLPAHGHPATEEQSQNLNSGLTLKPISFCSTPPCAPKELEASQDALPVLRSSSPWLA